MSNPSGLCRCGCGARTNLASETNKKRGQAKGEPLDYLRGHGTRKRPPDWPADKPLPRCACGCGQCVTLAKATEPGRGAVTGQPNRFVVGHYIRAVPGFHEEDRGYKTPCHIWEGQIDKLGYPRREAKSGTVLVHRQVWIAANGPLPPEIDAHHRCEQSDCVRLDHLEPRPRAVHLRAHRGVSPEKYEEILAVLRSAEESHAALARRFGVTSQYIAILRKSLA